MKALHEAAFFECNTQGTVNLLDAAIEHAPNLVRFVHVSSLEACGPSLDGKPVPLDQERPVTAYGRSKLAAEKEVVARKDKLPVVVLRPAAIYGPRDVEILEAFRAVKKRQYPVIGDGQMLGCYTYGPDCARACVQAIDANIAERQHLLRRRRRADEHAARDGRGAPRGARHRAALQDGHPVSRSSASRRSASRRTARSAARR